MGMQSMELNGKHLAADISLHGIMAGLDMNVGMVKIFAVCYHFVRGRHQLVIGNSNV